MPRALSLFNRLSFNLQESPMKITLPRVAPRNPLVRPCRFRIAGAHSPTGGAQRQRSSRELRREIDRMAVKERPPRR